VVAILEAAETARRDARTLELEAHARGLDDQPMMAATEVRDALAVSAVAIADARAEASAVPRAQAEMTAATLEVERLRGVVERSAAARASSQALATSTLRQSRDAGVEVTRLLADHREDCPCHRGEPAAVNDVGETFDAADGMDVTEVIARHHQTLGRLRSLDVGLHELGTLDATARAALSRLSLALRAHNLESMAQAEAAVLSPATVAELTTLLRTAEQQRAQADALLAQPDVTAALELPTPDVDALAEAHRRAAASLTEVDRRHTLSEQAQRELRTLSATVCRALADLGPAEQEAQLVQELADCFAGNSADNALRMRLSSYVLAARLAEIATLANERLRTMSDGRYTLEYSDARAAKGARSGLGLLVRDGWTGQPRETSSLSGGEAFMASLALALGMGDAVRAEAGGFDLQTLFVDEGFGSLDEESLEQVMAVLDALREGGRAVGIVSHVTELRTRIPQQLHVLKQQAGSRIQVNANATSAA
jgi:exonuclease SbcC